MLVHRNVGRNVAYKRVAYKKIRVHFLEPHGEVLVTKCSVESDLKAWIHYKYFYKYRIYKKFISNVSFL